MFKPGLYNKIWNSVKNFFIFPFFKIITYSKISSLFFVLHGFNLFYFRNCCKKQVKNIVIIMFCFMSILPVYAKNVNEYKNEIDTKNQALHDLQKALKEKRLEKEKCLLEEKLVRKEITKINKELLKLQKRGEAVKNEIRKAKRNVSLAAKEMSLANCEKKQWCSSLNHEMDCWYRDNYSYKHLYKDPVIEKMHFILMAQKKGYVGNAEKKELLSKKSVEKWQDAQKKLVALKSQHEATLAEQRDVMGQKEKFLKTTIGRRIIAEDEIKKIIETAKALEQLLIKLEREKKKTEKQAALQEQKKVVIKKKDLPWPVSGNVIVKFGKNKHPDLDTYVISNGIKIKSSPGANVNAVDSGEVIFTGDFRSYGLMIIVDHGGGFYTVYGHLGEINVEEGSQVTTASILGKISKNSQPVLYFEVRVDNKPEDPMLWLR